MSFLNYYDILNSKSDDNVEEIKRNYQKLARMHHPDKTLCLENSSSKFCEENKFPLINKAWNILRDPIKRKIYDAEAYEYHINLHNNVFAELILEDFHKYCESKDLCWSYQCRCGGSYLLDEQDIPKIDSILIVECNECSLTVKVIIKKESVNS